MERKTNAPFNKTSKNVKLLMEKKHVLINAELFWFFFLKIHELYVEISQTFSAVGIFVMHPMKYIKSKNSQQIEKKTNILTNKIWIYMDIFSKFWTLNFFAQSVNYWALSNQSLTCMFNVYHIKLNLWNFQMFSFSLILRH